MSVSFPFDCVYFYAYIVHFVLSLHCIYHCDTIAVSVLKNSLKRISDRGLNECAYFQKYIFVMFPWICKDGDTAGSVTAAYVFFQ